MSAPAPAPQPLDSEKFRRAVVDGDFSKVMEYLERDPALMYARDGAGNSVFILACLNRRKDVAEALVRRGLVLDIFEAAASGNVPRATELSKLSPGIVHTRSADGRTPLHYAAVAGERGMVGFLNAQGADLSAGPETPMLAVADFDDSGVAADMAQTLLGNASDPNARRKDGNTVLHIAAARGNAEVVRLLIHRGALVDAKNAGGRTPLDIATGEAVKVLRDADSIERAYYGARYAEDLRGKPVTRDDTQGLPQSFINEFVTIAHRDFEAVKRMLRQCPDLLMTRAIWDELAIEAAAHMGLVPMAQHLAELGSPVSTCTAVMLGLADRAKAAVRDDRNVLRERGAHDLPLLAYTAFGHERVEVAEILLKAGLDAGGRGFGQTTLHLAAGKGYVDLARLLLEHGADVNAMTRARVTPLAVAVRAKQSNMADLLKQHGGRT